MTPSAVRSEFEREQQEESRGVCPHCGQRLPRTTRPGPRAARILQAVAFEFDIEVADILGRDRHKRIARARDVACYLLRLRLRRSYPEIAEVIQRDDHTTAMGGVRAAEKWLREDPEATERLAAIEGILERVLTPKETP